MASMNTADPKNLARSLSVPERIVLAQAVTALLVLLAWVVIDRGEVASVLLGTLAVLLPNAWLAWQFRTTHGSGREVGQALAKFGLTIALILLVFVVFTPSAAGFFSTLVVCSLTPLLAPLFLAPATLAVVPQLPTQTPTRIKAPLAPQVSS